MYQETVIKFGQSNNLNERVKNHKKTYTNFRLYAAFKVKNKIEIENCIKKHSTLKNRLRIVTIDDIAHRELIALDNEEFTLEKVEQYIKDIIKEGLKNNFWNKNILLNLITVIEKEELDAIRNISPSFNSEFSAYTNGLDIHHWMERKAGIKALSKIIPTTNNNEIAKAVEYDSKFEGGARAFAELPKDGNEIVEPKLLGGKTSPNSIENAFDSFENLQLDEKNEFQNSFQIKQAPEPIKQAPEPIKEEIEKAVAHQKIPPVEPIKQETETDSDGLDWELPTGNEDDDEIPYEDEVHEENTSFAKGINFSDDDDDIRFEFPDNDEDDDDENESGLF
jgi:hypothetical protein